jgi:hypothetical protein
MNLILPRALMISAIMLFFIFAVRADDQTNQVAAAASATNAAPAVATEHSPAERSVTTNNVPATVVEQEPSVQPAATNAVPATLTGQTTPPAQPSAGAEDLSKEEMLKRLKELTDELRNVRTELNQLEAERAAEVARTNAVAAPAPLPAPSPQPAAPPPAGQPQTEEKPQVDEEQARLERERAIRSVQSSGVLLKQGSMEIEPSVTYSHYANNLIAIDGFSILPVLIIGEIESLRIERDIEQPALTWRYGILNNLQADVTPSYRFETDRYVQQIQSQPRTSTIIDDDGIADTQFGLSDQVLFEHGSVPDLILSARVTAPTGKSQFDFGSTNNIPTELAMGAGVWSVRGGVTAIKSLDPAVLILSAGYTHNLGRDFTVHQSASSNTVDNSGVTNTVNYTFPVRTTYELGDSIDYTIAIAMALNPVLAINLQIQEQITEDTYLAHIGKVQGSYMNQAYLRFGFGWALTHNSILNFSAAAGLTPDSPGLTVTLSMPIRF